MSVDALRGDIPLPGAGEGVSLRFRRVDCGVLQKEFGDEWFTGATGRLDRMDIAYISKCVEVGAKKGGKEAKVDIDSLDVSLMDICIAILDALYFAVHGKPFKDYIEELQRKIDEAKGELDDNPNQ